MNSDEQLAVLEACTGTRAQAWASETESVRRTLAALDAKLCSVLPAVTRKRVAARLLGVSVQALDRWIRLGHLPARRVSEIVSHEGVPTELLIDVAAHRRTGRRFGEAITASRNERQRARDLVDAHHLTIAANALAAGRTNDAA